MLTCSRCRVAALCVGGAMLEFYAMTNTGGGKDVVVRMNCRTLWGRSGSVVSKYIGNAPWDCQYNPYGKRGKGKKGQK